MYVYCIMCVREPLSLHLPLPVCPLVRCNVSALCVVGFLLQLPRRVQIATIYIPIAAATIVISDKGPLWIKTGKNARTEMVGAE